MSTGSRWRSWFECRLLALMESTRTDPHNDGCHSGPFPGQVGDAPVDGWDIASRDPKI